MSPSLGAEHGHGIAIMDYDIRHRFAPSNLETTFTVEPSAPRE